MIFIQPFPRNLHLLIDFQSDEIEHPSNKSWDDWKHMENEYLKFLIFSNFIFYI